MYHVLRSGGKGWAALRISGENGDWEVSQLIFAYVTVLAVDSKEKLSSLVREFMREEN